MWHPLHLVVGRQPSPHSCCERGLQRRQPRVEGGRLQICAPVDAAAGIDHRRTGGAPCVWCIRLQYRESLGSEPSINTIYAPHWMPPPESTTAVPARHLVYGAFACSGEAHTLSAQQRWGRHTRLPSAIQKCRLRNICMLLWRRCRWQPMSESQTCYCPVPHWRPAARRLLQSAGCAGVSRDHWRLPCCRNCSCRMARRRPSGSSLRPLVPRRRHFPVAMDTPGKSQLQDG